MNLLEAKMAGREEKNKRKPTREEDLEDKVTNLTALIFLLKNKVLSYHNIVKADTVRLHLYNTIHS